MREPNVIQVSFCKAFGFCLFWEMFNGTPSISILFPFVGIYIYFKKTEHNKWFRFARDTP